TCAVLTITLTENGTPPLTDDETFTLTIGNVNRPPVLQTIGNQTVAKGQTLTVPVIAIDPDGDIVALVATNLPAFATLTDHEDGTGMVVLTPGLNDAWVYM